MSGIANNYLSPAALVVALITFLKIWFDKNKRDKLYKVVSSRSWVINLIIIIGFSYYGLKILNDTSEDTSNLKSSIKTALLGMIIAFMAYFDLTLAPFWILFVSSYYLGISG